jgi:hypothetical protein
LLIPAAEFASHAHPTVSLASPTLSAMPAMPDMTSPMASASPQLSHAPVVNSDTMVCAMPPAQLAAAPKETSARGFAPLDHGHSTVAATELAPPNTQPTMPVLSPAPQEHPSSMEFARPVPNPAHQASSTMPVLPHARLASILALSAH